MLPVAAALRYVRARRLIYGKAHMPLSAMTYVWDAENAPGNALHPSLRLYRGMQLSRIHPTIHVTFASSEKGGARHEQ